MIQASDLRIGNLVQRPKDLRIKMLDGDRIYFLVDSIMIRDCEYYKDNWAFEPIELTEDILVKCCGFEKPTDDNFGGYLSPKFQNGRIRILNNKWWNGCWDTEITYLHELQNLIHSLTKKELVIDLTKL